MTRIFVTLAILSTLCLGAAFWLGLSIGDPAVRDPGVQQTVSYHMLVGLGSLVFAVLVHAIVLTYFMGTGRWLEETTRAYKLSNDWHRESHTLKYRTIPAMTFCLLLLIVTGGFGGAADPASAVGFKGWQGMSPGSIHMTVAMITFGINLCANLWEFLVLQRNGEVVNEVLAEVRRIRLQHGLEV